MLELNDKYEFVGFYDPNDDNAKAAIESFGIKRFESMDELLDATDCIDIVTPTFSHFDCASKALRKRCSCKITSCLLVFELILCSTVSI